MKVHADMPPRLSTDVHMMKPLMTKKMSTPLAIQSVPRVGRRRRSSSESMCTNTTIVAAMPRNICIAVTCRSGVSIVNSVLRAQ